MYRGWYKRRVEVDFDVGRYGVDYVMVAEAPGRANARGEAEAQHPKDQMYDNTPEQSGGEGR